MQSIKCVVVGDGAVGKTTLLIAQTYRCFSQDYIPTVFDNFAALVKVGDRAVAIGLWDTAGQEDYDKVRQASYGTSQGGSPVNVALMLFSVVNPASFENLKGKVHKYCPNCPIILVGTKTDLRNDESTVQKLKDAGKATISQDDAWKLAKKFGCVTYMECSSVEQKGIDEIFLEIVRTHLNFGRDKKPGKHCWDPVCTKELGITAKKVKCDVCHLKFCPGHVDSKAAAAESAKAKERFHCHKCQGKPLTTPMDEKRRKEREELANSLPREDKVPDKEPQTADKEKDKEPAQEKGSEQQPATEHKETQQENPSEAKQPDQPAAEKPVQEAPEAKPAQTQAATVTTSAPAEPKPSDAVAAPDVRGSSKGTEEVGTDSDRAKPDDDKKSRKKSRSDLRKSKSNRDEKKRSSSSLATEGTTGSN